MPIRLSEYQKVLIRELKEMPKEYLPNLLEIVHLYKESVTLKPARESFRQGWREVKEKKTMPISQLWEGISAE